MMSMLKKIVLFPISLFVAFLALMARWLLTLSSYVVAPLTLSEISKSIQGHQRQLTAEERTFLKASIDNRYQERAVANGSLMMCEVQGAKEDFIRRWNSIFKEYPDVFEDSDCRKIIHDLTEDAVQYLLKIKEKTL